MKFLLLFVLLLPVNAFALSAPQDITGDPVCYEDPVFIQTYDGGCYGPNYNPQFGGDGNLYNYYQWEECGFRYADGYSVTVIACDPPEPATCSNSIADPDELGVDCGGSCNAACVATCPEGTTIEPNGNEYICLQEISPDQYGNCPNLTDWYYYPAGGGYPAICSTTTDPYMGAEVPVLPGVSDPWVSTDISNESSTVATVDNGDGTSTKTTTTSITNNEGDTQTTTNNEIINNTTGDTISSNSTVTTVNNSADAPSVDVDAIIRADNANTEKITTALTDLTEDVEGTEASILAAVGTGIDSGLTDQETLLSDEMNAIGTEYSNSPTTWISSETITDKVAFLPAANTSCQDVGYTLTNGYTVTIPCSAMERIKELLSILFSVLTLIYLYDLIFRQDIVKA